MKVVAHWEGETLVLQYSADGAQIAAFTLKLSAGGKQMLRDGTFTGGKAVREVYEKQ